MKQNINQNNPTEVYWVDLVPLFKIGNKRTIGSIEVYFVCSELIGRG
jgi:hypothetical protein